MQESIGNVEDKIPEIIFFVTTIVINTKIRAVESKVPYISGLVTTTNLNVKIGEIENNITVIRSRKLQH